MLYTLRTSTPLRNCINRLDKKRETENWKKKTMKIWWGISWRLIISWRNRQSSFFYLVNTNDHQLMRWVIKWMPSHRFTPFYDCDLATLFDAFFFSFPLTVYRRTSRCGRQSHVPKFPDHQRQQNGKKENKNKNKLFILYYIYLMTENRSAVSIFQYY
jgi:hypothetical protein